MRTNGRGHIVGLIPAHAGKTAMPRALSLAVAAHPRSRGENSHTPEIVEAIPGSSPLTRGKRPDSPVAAARRRLIPAHAGKTPRVSS